ncbi:hypothetical protein ABGB12_25615 [Actinocorallia sp. B10E7]|uniref:hypothetical protein n=1 Tax=Actinocorallia sp. B10E7 TaxID=3153558 RepID=UPI00325E5A00
MRSELHAWVLDKAKEPHPGELTGSSPLFSEGWLRSVHLPDLLLYMERLRGAPIDVEDLRPGDFRDIDTLVLRFGTPS